MGLVSGWFAVHFRGALGLGVSRRGVAVHPLSSTSLLCAPLSGVSTWIWLPLGMALAAWACMRMEILFSLASLLLCCCAARTFCLRGYGPLRDRFMCHTAAPDLLLSDLAFHISACGWHARQKCSNLFLTLSLALIWGLQAALGPLSVHLLGAHTFLPSPPSTVSS